MSDPVKVKVPVVRSSGPDKTRPPGQIEIAPPKPFVDPGPLKKPEKAAPELKGKKVAGEIGDLKVTFEFADGGKLGITGDATGAGKWKQDGSALSMETQVATYRGTVTEAGAAGLRIWKDGTKPLTPWHADLRAKVPDKADAKEYQIEYRQYIAGQWRGWNTLNWLAGYRGEKEYEGPFTLAEAKTAHKKAEAKFKRDATESTYPHEFRVVDKSGMPVK